MHMIDASGTLVKVNRRWSQTLRYRRKEALGRKSVEFLTDQSRAVAIEETLPLFWRVGSARNVGYRFVRSDGRRVDIQLDGELVAFPGGACYSYTALGNVDDLKQWKHASGVIRTLKKLARAQSRYASVLSAAGMGGGLTTSPESRRSSAHALSSGNVDEVLGPLLEVAGDIFVSLSALSRVHDEWLGAVVEQQNEMLMFAKSIDRTLAELVDTMVATHGNEER